MEGTVVQKRRGYRFPGVVLCEFRTLKGEPRVVVECTVPEVAGCLHIFNWDQLEVDPASSNGRTAAFGAENGGSSPSAGTSDELVEKVAARLWDIAPHFPRDWGEFGEHPAAGWARARYRGYAEELIRLVRDEKK